jgi:hypothetical protein
MIGLRGQFGSRSIRFFLAIIGLVAAGLQAAEKPGIFRNGYYWVLDSDGNRQFQNPPDSDFHYAGVGIEAGDQPIVGDWNGDGKAEVGLFRPSTGIFYLDFDGSKSFNPSVDKQFSLGVGTQSGDVAVVGDWNGNGRSKIGLFRYAIPLANRGTSNETE